MYKLFTCFVLFLVFSWLVGGIVFINGIRLFDTWLIKGVLRYDQLLHFINSFTLTLLLCYTFKVKGIVQKFYVALMVLGIGAIYEVIELGAVVFLDASQGVGDYMNNACDLLFNSLGAISSIFIIKGGTMS